MAAWIALSNRYEHLEPVREAVVDLVTALGEKVLTSGEDPPRHIPSALLLITLCAFGDAVIGGPLREMLGRDRDAVRRLAANLLPALIE